MTRITLASVLLAACLVGCQPPNSERDTTGVNHDLVSPTVDLTTGDPDTLQRAEVTDAYATLHAIGESGVIGEIKFARKAENVVMVTGQVSGLTPGKHGFHVHEKGDLSDTEKGESVGGHFNPTGMDHGRLEDKERHAGDFGNIVANENGVAEINFEDTLVQLHGPNSIVGRAIVIHAEEDKFTQPAGDAGGRVAFGKIEAGKR